MKIYPFKTLLVFVLALQGTGCSRPVSSRLAISGGEPPAAESPAMLSTVSLVKIKSKQPHSYCSATLIAPRLLLTAAHCLDGIKTPNSIQALFGRSALDEKRNLRPVESYRTFLPIGSLQFPNFDIAWIKLKDDAPEPWRPIPILDDGAALKDLEGIDDGLLLAGFGRQSTGCSDDSCNGTLMETKSKLKRYVNHAHFVQLLSTGPTPPRGVCNGDSGGPAYAQILGTWYVLGPLNGKSARLNSAAVIDSAGVCETGEAVFSFAGAYKNWIAASSGIHLPGESRPTASLMDPTVLGEASDLGDFLGFNNYREDIWATAAALYEQFEKPELRIEPDFDLMVTDSSRAAEAMQKWGVFAYTGVVFDPSTFKMADKQLGDMRPIGKLSSLDSLELIGNRIRDTRPLGQLKKLKSLRLSNNYDFASKEIIAFDLSFLAELPALEQLDLSDNTNNLDLDKIPWENLPALRTLIIEDSQLTSLRGLERAVSLRTIRLRNNRIFDLTPLLKLQDLNEIDLSQNAVNDLKVLERLPHLKKLNALANPSHSIDCGEGVTCLVDQVPLLDFAGDSGSPRLSIPTNNPPGYRPVR